MAGSFALVAALILLYVFALSPLVAAETYLFLCAALLVILTLILFAYLKRGGSRRFLALDS
jgi:hypothetical protein